MPTFYDKVGLLVIDPDHYAFLVCRKFPKHDFDSGKAIVRQRIMPGGTREHGETDEECLRREISEELDTEIGDLIFLDTYSAPAAGHIDDSTVRIKLYQGALLTTPTPSNEIQDLRWIGSADSADDTLSEIIKDYILPDLIQQGIIK